MIFAGLLVILIGCSRIYLGVHWPSDVLAGWCLGSIWALFAFLPERKRYGWGMLGYAVTVAIATIYGRYHYAADAAAGLAVSLVPAVIILLARPLRVRLVELP